MRDLYKIEEHRAYLKSIIFSMLPFRGILHFESL